MEFSEYLAVLRPAVGWAVLLVARWPGPSSPSSLHCRSEEETVVMRVFRESLMVANHQLLLGHL